MGELHLEIIVDRLLREFKVDATSASRRLPIVKLSAVRSRPEGRFVRQTGGHGQFGVVELRIEPIQKVRFRIRRRYQGRRYFRNFIPRFEQA